MHILSYSSQSHEFYPLDFTNLNVRCEGSFWGTYRVCFGWLSSFGISAVSFASVSIYLRKGWLTARGTLLLGTSEGLR